MNGHRRYALICALMTTALLFATRHVTAAPADNPQILSSFCPPQQYACRIGGPTDFVRASDGAYYGITQFGGPTYRNLASGAVYRVDPLTREINIWHRFDPTSEGQTPLWLKAGPDGNLYGALESTGPNGYNGNIFRLSLAGEFTILHAYPVSGGARATESAPVEAAGNWFGIVQDSYAGATGVFGLTPNGNYRTLYSFQLYPYCVSYASGLVRAPDGNLYGVTAAVGSDVCGGTLYRIEPNGLHPIFTVLHNFDTTSEGYPDTGLTVGPDQALYGTASLANGEAMFRMNLDGQFAELDTFGDASTHGSNPYMAPLTLMPDGYLYGARTHYTNNLYVSEIFRLSLAGEYTQLHVFDPPTEGWWPEAPLSRGFDNALYGTNFKSGKNNRGTLFRYVPPPVQ